MSEAVQPTRHRERGEEEARVGGVGPHRQGLQERDALRTRFGDAEAQIFEQRWRDDELRALGPVEHGLEDAIEMHDLVAKRFVEEAQRATATQGARELAGVERRADATRELHHATA